VAPEATLPRTVRVRCTPSAGRRSTSAGWCGPMAATPVQSRPTKVTEYSLSDPEDLLPVTV